MKINNLKDAEVRASLPLSEEVSILQEVAEMTVSRELGYLPIIEQVIYRKAMIEHFTGISLFSGDDFNLDSLADFLQQNQTDVDRIIHQADPDDRIAAACHEAVQYRVNHGVGSSIDYLFESLARYLNSAAKQEIDPDAVQAVKDLVPLLQNIDSADVAKAIIDHDKKIVQIRQEGSDYEG